MHVLVTGSSGAIGRRLVRVLTAHGHQVRTLSRSVPQQTDRGVEYCRGDLLDVSALERVARGIQCVVHLAAVTHTHKKELYEQVNVSGTRLLTAASKRGGVGRFLFMSSRTASTKGGAYARSKLRAEDEVRSADIPWVILRPAEVYGTGGSEAIGRVIRAVMVGRVVPVIGRGDARVAPVYVDDVLGACAKAVVSRNVIGKTYTLAGPEEMTLTQLVDRIEKKLGKHRLRLHIPIPLVRALAHLAALAGSGALVRDQVPRLLCPKPADISLARADLDYKPRTLEQGLDAILGCINTSE